MKSARTQADKSEVRKSHSKSLSIRLLTFIALAVAIIFEASAAKPKNEGKIDFAYPQDALKQSEAMLKAAEKSGNSEDICRAALYIFTAKVCIDTKAAPEAYNIIKGLREKELKKVSETKSAGVKEKTTLALLDILSAQVLKAVYNYDRYKYDNTKTPLSPLPDNIAEWNEKQFKTERQRLIDEAVTLAPDIKNVPVSDYKKLLSYNREGEIMCPNMGLFIMNQAIHLSDKEISDKINDKKLELCEEGSYPWASCMIYKYGKDSDNEPANSLFNLYRKYSRFESSGLFLYRAGHIYINDFFNNRYSNEDSGHSKKSVKAKEMLSTINDYLKHFPTSYYFNDLKNLSNLYLRTDADITNIPRTVYPGQKLDLKVSWHNAKKLRVAMYDKDSGKDIETVTIPCRSDLPYASDTTLTFTAAKPGNYSFSMKIDEQPVSQQSWGQMKCVPFVPVSITNVEIPEVFIADFKTGKPIEDASLFAVKTDYHGKVKARKELGRTSAEGIAKIKRDTPSGMRYLEIKKGTESYNFYDVNVYADRDREKPEKEYDGIVITDRKLYHRGDKVEFTLIAASSDNGKISMRPVSGKKVFVTMEDANRQPLDTIKGVTDEMGQFSGSFILPKECLTGEFDIESFIMLKDDEEDGLGSCHITVSDFKLPTFEVKITDVRRDVPAKGEVTIEGRAETYTGMGVGGAEVTANISQALRWRFFFPRGELGTVKAMTDGDGKFSFVVPDSILSRSEMSGHNYYCKISVTNPAGEAQQAENGFTTGKQLAIAMPSNEKIVYNTAVPVLLGAEIYDGNGKKVSEPLVWKLTKEDKEVASGEMSGPEAKIDLSAVDAGVYSLQLVTKNPEIADTLTTRGITLYNTAKNLMPDEDIIFLPKASYYCGKDRTANVGIGISCDSVSLYIAHINGKKIENSRIVNRDKGFFGLNVTVPSFVDQSEVMLVAVKDGKICARKITVDVIPDHTLNITASSFRDRITPGAQEKWTFNIAASEGKTLGKARLMATMYNQALNALESWGRFLKFDFNRRYSNSYFDFPSISTFGTSASGKYPKMLKGFNPEGPSFNPEVSLYNPFRFAKNLYFAEAPAVREESADMEKEAALEDRVVVGYGTQKKSNATGGIAAALDGMVPGLKIRGVQSRVENVSPTEIGGGGEVENASKFSYRPAETLQAFWMPAIRVNDDGSAVVEFTAPDNIGSWNLKMFAWNEELSSGNFSAIIQATKPVMVVPQTPRFLRRGDKAVVVSTVYNNSDSVSVVKVVSEKFDLISGRTLDSAEETLEIAAGKSATSSFTLRAGADEETTGFRVRAISGKFTDGEQVLIPVLEAYSEVIEGESYWLNPGEGSLDITLPEGKKAQTVFSFNDNPAWDVIKILPSLSIGKPYSAPQAAEALFEAYTSSGIVTRNKEVEPMLKEWLANPEDSALMSKLSQNDALKQASLNLSPWMQDASSDTRRMASLALLLDRKQVEKSISTAMKALRKFQTPEGGFKWGEWSREPSMWATWASLNALGRLKLAGYWPKSKELDEIVIKAVTYYENQLSERKDLMYQPGYAYGVSLIPGKPLTLKGQRILDYTLKKMAADWRMMTPTSKARAAITLHLNGFKSTAAEILRSLDQFAVPAGKGKGAFIPRADIDEVAEILLTYGAINPQSPRVNELRQWLVARTAVTTQLGAWDPTLLAAAFMATGAKWTVPVNEPSLTVDGKDFTLPKSARATGTFTVQIPSDDAGKALSLKRGNTEVPAYGSVFTRAKRLTTEVKAKDCNELSIDKKIMLVDGKDGKYVKSLKLGQKVRILLTIKAESDLEYVTVIDQRPACLEPVDQLPGYTQSGSVWFYRENGDSETRLFIDYLPRGVYTIAIDMTVGNAGEYISGLATAQSQLAPAITAHSAGSTIKVE